MYQRVAAKSRTFAPGAVHTHSSHLCPRLLTVEGDRTGERLGKIFLLTAEKGPQENPCPCQGPGLAGGLWDGGRYHSGWASATELGFSEGLMASKGHPQPSGEGAVWRWERAAE